MPPLDGKTPIKPIPFDAHEQVARVSHEAAPLEPGSAHSGLQVKDAEESPAEYPNAVDHVENVYDRNHLEPVLVNSAEEEKACGQTSDKPADKPADSEKEPA